MPRVLSGKIIFYVFLLLLADVCLAPAAGLVHFRPIFSYLIVAYAAFRWHWKSALAAAMAAGIFRDLAGSRALGVETLSLVMATAGLLFFMQKIERHSFVVQFIVNFIFVFSISLLILFFESVLGLNNQFSGYFLRLSFSTALSTSVLMPVFFHFAARVFKDGASRNPYGLFTY